MPVKKRFKLNKLLPVHRERRQIKPRKQVSCRQLNFKWTLGDKKKLLHALKLCDVEDIEKIQQDFLPHRYPQEIDHFLKKMKMKSYLRPVLPKEKVPIELWVDLAEDLTLGVTDCSTVLGEVLSKIENEEVHDEKCNTTDPNWHAIYNYLVMQLRGEEVTDIGPVEAGILLDLLNVVASHLQSLDISNQQLLMARKYALLSARVGYSNRAKAFEMARKALEEDLLAPVQSSTTGCASAASCQNVAGSSAEKTSSTSRPSEVEATSRGDSDNNTTGCQRVNSVGCDPASTSAAAANCVLKSRQSPLFAINPFCIPIKYLNPKKLPPEKTSQTLPPQTETSYGKCP